MAPASDAKSTSSFAERKADLLFYRRDEEWSSHRPGVIYVVPTRYATVDKFKAAHLSKYMRNKSGKPTVRKPNVKSGKPRKPYTKKNPVEYARQNRKNSAVTHRINGKFAMKYKQ